MRPQWGLVDDEFDLSETDSIFYHNFDEFYDLLLSRRPPAESSPLKDPGNLKQNFYAISAYREWPRKVLETAKEMVTIYTILVDGFPASDPLAVEASDAFHLSRREHVAIAKLTNPRLLDDMYCESCQPDHYILITLH